MGQMPIYLFEEFPISLTWLILKYISCLSHINLQSINIIIIMTICIRFLLASNNQIGHFSLSKCMSIVPVSIPETKNGVKKNQIYIYERNSNSINAFNLQFLNSTPDKLFIENMCQLRWCRPTKNGTKEKS